MSSSSNAAVIVWLTTAACVSVHFFLHRQRDDARNKKQSIPEELRCSPLARELQVAVNLALKAGQAMYSYCDEKGTSKEDGHCLDIVAKGQANDFCTKVDCDNEVMVTKGLQQCFPSHKVIGEESTGTSSIPLVTSDPTWIIDPIDGTTNFAAGLPLTCVSVGLCMDRRPVLGVVYAPMTDELFVALEGYGAYRNGTRITRRKDKKLLDAIVCFEFGYVREKSAIALIVGAVQRLLEHGCRATRSLGSGVLDLCYVATGRIDVVYAGVAGEGWKPWDYCAGCLVAKEANCAIEAIQVSDGSRSFDLYSSSIICAVGDSLLNEVRNILVESSDNE